MWYNDKVRPPKVFKSMGELQFPVFIRQEFIEFQSATISLSSAVRQKLAYIVLCNEE